MKAKKVGQKFETYLKNSIPNNIMCLRLKDGPKGFTFNANPSDYVLFNGKLLLFCECKTIQTKSFPLNLISQGQFFAMVQECVIKNVLGGWLINFRELNETYFLPLQTYLTYRIDSNKKSVSPKDLSEIGILVPLRIVGKRAQRLDIEYLFSKLEAYYESIFDNDEILSSTD